MMELRWLGKEDAPWRQANAMAMGMWNVLLQLTVRTCGLMVRTGLAVACRGSGEHRKWGHDEHERHEEHDEHGVDCRQLHSILCEHSARHVSGQRASQRASQRHNSRNYHQQIRQYASYTSPATRVHGSAITGRRAERRSGPTTWCFVYRLTHRTQNSTASTASRARKKEQRPNTTTLVHLQPLGQSSGHSELKAGALTLY